jgi:plastocyanin
MNETLFYVFGIGLVVSALAVSAIGLRVERFPATRTVLVAMVVYFAGMVAATTTFAVLNAADEQRHREAEQAQEEAANASEGEATTATTTTAAPATEAPPAAEAGATLKLAADLSAIAYDTKQLSGEAGKVTIEFDNPSPITHDVCIDSPSGQEIGCSQTISEDSTSLSESLKPGKYTFFCSVDGHEAAGMKGTLTID